MSKPLAILAVLLGVALGSPALSAPPRYTPAPCPAPLGVVAARATCGKLSVDETRGSRDGRRVSLPVVVLRAARPRGLPPVIFLHGGPGDGVVEQIARMNLTGPDAWIGVDQDWIFFDQRGARMATPGLDCGRLNLTDAGPDSDATVAALKACAARHVASGVDLSRYNSVQDALDVQDLRHALGLKRFDLVGYSYGTRVALEVARTAPSGVRAVVLDSLWPPEAKWAENGAKPVADAVRQVLALCAADPACARDKPDLQARTDALVRRWLLAAQTNKEGRAFPVDDFAQFAMDAVYDATMVRQLPDDLQRFTAGDFAPLAAYDDERSAYMEALHLAVLCKEQFPFEHRDAVARNAGQDPIAQALARTLVRYFDACAGYPVGPADPAQARPVSSGLPMLIVDAGIDPGCPPQLAAEVLTHLPRGQSVLVPNTTHGPAQNDPCAGSIAQAFLRDPSAPVDKGCLATHPAHISFPEDASATHS